MEPLSRTNAVAICSRLSRAAQSIATKIESVLGTGAVAETEPKRRLPYLRTRLQQFRQHVDQLGHCVAGASPVHRQLGEAIIQGLADCESGLTAMSDSLEQVFSGLKVEALSDYERFAAAFSRFFVFAAQLLTIETEEEQQSRLDNQDAQDIPDVAHQAYLRVSSLKAGSSENS
ncbi:hypothetical protein VTK56DRAFT_6135 [Thermocarpiscus australiensis]